MYFSYFEFVVVSAGKQYKLMLRLIANIRTLYGGSQHYLEHMSPPPSPPPCNFNLFKRRFAEAL